MRITDWNKKAREITTTTSTMTTARVTATTIGTETQFLTASFAEGSLNTAASFAERSLNTERRAMVLLTGLVHAS